VAGPSRPGGAARVAGLIRLGHPFPSLLDAAVAGVVATIAGADAPRALLLATAMLLLQLGIGAANDWADAPLDRLARGDKPIPAGLVSRRTAAWVAAAAAGAGLLLAASAGAATLLLAGIGLGAGLAYDLRLKGTRWSWLPYAVGIPLLPLFGWVGAVGSVPPSFAVLLPVAMVAGAALAVANALADLERDERAGTETVATILGTVRARRAGAVLQTAVVVGALGSALALGGTPAGIALGVVGAATVGVGVGLGWGRGHRSLQRAWEVQAIGLAILAVGWVGALAVEGRLAG
jgi:4-hydroxybenzoate polyprenyltransferase